MHQLTTTTTTTTTPASVKVMQVAGCRHCSGSRAGHLQQPTLQHCSTARHGPRTTGKQTPDLAASPGHASSLQVSLLLLGLLASCWDGSPPPAPAPPLDIAVVEHGHAAPLHAHVDKKCHVAEVELIAEVMLDTCMLVWLAASPIKFTEKAPTRS